ncbi:MAG: GNAT family N-acetyltransferase [Verrucomicrobiota bacterium]
MSNLQLRPLQTDDWDQLAVLIFESTNDWYAKKLNRSIFTGDPSCALVFPEVYEALDPGCCLVMEDTETGRLAGSCFFRERETHWSLGIMNAHADYAGQRVAATLLGEILQKADATGKPLRLVSSAMNLDSYSLYNRHGFVPQKTFQDMFVNVPEGGLDWKPEGFERVRPAVPGDSKPAADLELELHGIRREKDIAHFIANEASIWHASVIETEDGEVSGFLASVNHPGSNMIGPGFASTEADALALLAAELDVHRGRSPVFLVPVDATEMVRELYAIKARNCELHFAQCRGGSARFDGVWMPSFMPETG